MVTWGSDESVTPFQSQSDRDYVGDLIGNKVQDCIAQFRSLMPPLPSCKPLLRANSAKGYGLVFPLVAIEFGRGLFLIGGMHLGLSGSRENESSRAFEIGTSAVEAIVFGIKNKRIPPHDTRALKN
jgi:hypothetical protein